MARAAVKAKQQAQAQAAKAAKPTRARGRRKHASGGNPNQQLFFVRLRRRQKWIYAGLALIFAVSFAGLGVGSGQGGLSDLYQGLFGGNSGAVGKAQAEIAKHPAKGYRDLAIAYETKGDLPSAITALQSYLRINKKDAGVWTQLAGLEQSQYSTYQQQYQAAQQAAQQANPSSPFTLTGKLASAFSNPADSYYAQQTQAVTSQLYQQATAAAQGALDAFQHVQKLKPHDPQVHAEIAGVALQTGNYALALTEYKTYLKLAPNALDKSQVQATVKQLQAIVHPPAPKKK